MCVFTRRCTVLIRQSCGDNRGGQFGSKYRVIGVCNLLALRLEVILHP